MPGTHPARPRGHSRPPLRTLPRMRSRSRFPIPVTATVTAADSVSSDLLGRRRRRGVPASHEQRGRAEGDRIVCEHAAHAPAASLRAGRGVRERAPRECPSRELLGPEAKLFLIRVGSQQLRERHVRSRPVLPTLEAMRMGCGLCRGRCPGRLPDPGRGPGHGHGRLFVSKFEPRGSQGKSKAPRGFSLGSSQAAPSIRNGRSPGQQRDALWLPLFPSCPLWFKPRWLCVSFLRRAIAVPRDGAMAQ